LIKIYDEFVQGTDEWHAARCGLLTASEVKLILTPTLKLAANDKAKSHVYEILAQRITGYTEPSYISDDMLRGYEDEIKAIAAYSKHFSPVGACGFMTNDKWGFTLGYSPDGLVGDDGQVECKSRRQKYQVQTIVDNVADGVCVDDYVLQVQTGLLVSERKWCDLISYSGGLPMATIRVYPDEEIQNAIIEAAAAFEKKVCELLEKYEEILKDKRFKLIPTEREIEQEITL